MNEVFRTTIYLWEFTKDIVNHITEITEINWKKSVKLNYKP